MSDCKITSYVDIDSAVVFPDIEKVDVDGSTAYSIGVHGYNSAYKYAGIVRQSNGVDFVAAFFEDFSHGAVLIAAMINGEVYSANKIEDYLNGIEKENLSHE